MLEDWYITLSIDELVNRQVTIFYFTCSKTDQFLSQAEELQVRFRILDANILRFGVSVPWFSHHFAA